MHANTRSEKYFRAVELEVGISLANNFAETKKYHKVYTSMKLAPQLPIFIKLSHFNRF